MTTPAEKRQKAIKALFPFCQVSPIVENESNGVVRFEVCQMYDRPEISYEVMAQVANIFGTKMMKLSDGRNLNGCDTCDYGSERGIVFCLWDVNFAVLNMFDGSFDED